MGMPDVLRGDDAYRLAAGPLQPRHQRLLDVQALDDHLDHPIHLRQQLEVVVRVADGDQVRAVGAGEVGRAGLGHAREQLLDHAIACRAVGGLFHAQTGRGDIEQDDWNARIRQMRRNPAPHRPRADDADFVDLIGHQVLLM